MNEFILQCKNCSTILAISQNYVNDPFQKPYDAFHIGANVCKSINTVVSSEVFDKGAEYNDLICNGCHAPVGKVYQKTVDSVANLQKLFLFRKTTTKKFRPQLSLIPGITQIPQENRDESLRTNALPIKSQASSSDDGSKNNADAIQILSRSLKIGRSIRLHQHYDARVVAQIVRCEKVLRQLLYEKIDN